MLDQKHYQLPNEMAHPKLSFAPLRKRYSAMRTRRTARTGTVVLPLTRESMFTFSGLLAPTQSLHFPQRPRAAFRAIALRCFAVKDYKREAPHATRPSFFGTLRSHTRIQMALHKIRCRRLLFLAVFSITVTTAQYPNSGRQQYESRCSRCHGADATGGESGPNILPQIDALTDADLGSFLRSGRPARGMPAFDLPAQDLAALVGYLHILIPTARNQPPVIARKRVQTTGGESIEGRVLNQGMSELQLQSDDKRIHLLRNAARGPLSRSHLANRLAHISWRPQRQPLHQAHANR